MADTSLRSIRESINATREDIVRKSQSLSIGTIRNAEKGNRVTYATAQTLLLAINILLQEAGQSPVTLEALGLNLY